MGKPSGVRLLCDESAGKESWMVPVGKRKEQKRDEKRKWMPAMRLGFFSGAMGGGQERKENESAGIGFGSHLPVAYKFKIRISQIIYYYYYYYFTVVFLLTCIISFLDEIFLQKNCRWQTRRKV